MRRQVGGDDDPFARRWASPLDVPRTWFIEPHRTNDIYSLNTYRACDVRCAYCITVVQGTSVPRRPRHEVAAQLTSELDELPPVDHLGVGTLVDAYPSVERDLGVTRAALEVLAERGVGVNLVTKGPTVVRDADLLARTGVEVQVSIPSFDDRLATIEVGAESPSARLRALELLRACGVAVRLQVSPWIPGLSDVARARAAVAEDVPITVTPLRLPAYLDNVGRVLGLTQAEVNESYRRQYEEVGPLPGVLWSPVAPGDGSPVHISRNVGRPRLAAEETDPATDPSWVSPLGAARTRARSGP